MNAYEKKKGELSQKSKGDGKKHAAKIEAPYNKAFKGEKGDMWKNMERPHMK